MLANELPVHRARRAARANPELHVSSAAVANDLSSATNDSPDHLGYLEVLGIGDMESLLGEGQTCKKKKSLVDVSLFLQTIILVFKRVLEWDSAEQTDYNNKKYEASRAIS